MNETKVIAFIWKPCVRMMMGKHQQSKGGVGFNEVLRKTRGRFYAGARGKIINRLKML